MIYKSYKWEVASRLTSDGGLMMRQWTVHDVMSCFALFYCYHVINCAGKEKRPKYGCCNKCCLLLLQKWMLLSDKNGNFVASCCHIMLSEDCCRTIICRIKIWPVARSCLSSERNLDFWNFGVLICLCHHDVIVGLISGILLFRLKMVTACCQFCLHFH